MAGLYGRTAVRPYMCDSDVHPFGRTAVRPYMCDSDVEPKVDHFAVVDDVVLAFEA